MSVPRTAGNLSCLLFRHCIATQMRSVSIEFYRGNRQCDCICNILDTTIIKFLTGYVFGNLVCIINFLSL